MSYSPYRSFDYRQIKGNPDAYRDGWDRIFGKKEVPVTSQLTHEALDKAYETMKQQAAENGGFDKDGNPVYYL